MQKNQNRTTIKDVAIQADVSIATVSKIINGKDEHISEETRQRVFEVIGDLGYVPNSMAKSLKEANTKTLGLVIPDIGNAFPEMAKGCLLYTSFRKKRGKNWKRASSFITIIRTED